MHHLPNFALKTLPVIFLRNWLDKNVQKAGNSNDKQLLIDVSAISQIDAGSGIQRVVRNLYRALLASPPKGYKICPIAATKKNGYTYLPTNFLQLSPVNSPHLPPIPVQTNAEDIFLGLDLSAHLIPHHLPQLQNWKLRGVHISFIIYDLLPVLEPDWFNPKSTQNFNRWLRTIAIFANNTIAISKTVQTDFSKWMQKRYDLDIPCSIIPLGAELDTQLNNPHTSALTAQMSQELNQHPFVLMVGTIEPRKAYAEALNAFESLWTKGDQTRLVIVGKPGWKVDSLITQLKTHAETGNRLIWLNTAGDDTLKYLYQQCLGVLITSKGEGYGLPLMEATHFNKPVLARDIPIFREIAGNIASYFSEMEPNNLIQALPKWLNELKISNNTKRYPALATWEISCAQLIKTLLQTPTLINANPNIHSNTPV
jgi:glycosyltransferase involved in cell wall biosynthesis